MGKLLYKIDTFISKIGKPNFMLILFIVFMLVVTGLYTTFSLNTVSDGLTIVDGLDTYRFIINDNDSSNVVNIPAYSSKNIAITVNNSEDIRLKFGINYSTSDDLTDVMIGYIDSSDYKGIDVLDANTSGVVTIKIYNDSMEDKVISFGFSYGLENGGDLKLDENKHWVPKLEFERFNLNEAKYGSYVSYTGNNGCEKDTCIGKNVNYVDDSNYGYCKNESDRFLSYGWRVAYVKDSSPYIISASSPECLDLNDFSVNSDKLDKIALKYCNSKYVYGGNCDSINVWNMNINDFKNITDSYLYYNTLDDNSCFEATENKKCGYGNDIIDNGGWYWLSDEAGIGALTYSWDPISRYISYGDNLLSYGVRPVFRLDTDIEVIGGKGTMDEPYIIRNKETYDE